MGKCEFLFLQGWGVMKYGAEYVVGRRKNVLAPKDVGRSEYMSKDGAWRCRIRKESMQGMQLYR